MLPIRAETLHFRSKISLRERNPSGIYLWGFCENFDYLISHTSKSCDLSEKSKDCQLGFLLSKSKTVKILQNKFSKTAMRTWIDYKLKKKTYSGRTFQAKILWVRISNVMRAFWVCCVREIRFLQRQHYVTVQLHC